VKKKFLKIFCITCFFSVFFDQISKHFILKTLKNGEIEISRFFSFTLVKNKGVLFGLFNNSYMKIPIIVISFAVILAILMYALNVSAESKFLLFSLGLVEGGIIGNLIDRVRFSYVIDFLNFKVWPVFNFGDIFIVIGTFLTIFYQLRRTNAS